MEHYVAVQLRVRLSAVDGALREAREAQEADALHRLRVATRRYLQAIRLFANFLDRKQVKPMRRRLGHLIDRCGAVRDCDVAPGVLDSAGFEGMREELISRRAARQGKLTAHLRRWHGVKHWAKFLVPERLPHMTAAAYAHRTMPRMLDGLFTIGERAVTQGDDDVLHQFRLLAKRFRYSLELFADVYGPETRRCLRAFGLLQDRLGAIQDCRASLKLVSGHSEAEAAVRGLLETRRREFVRFWQTFRRHHADWKEWLKGGEPHAPVSAASRRG